MANFMNLGEDEITPLGASSSGLNAGDIYKHFLHPSEVITSAISAELYKEIREMSRRSDAHDLRIMCRQSIELLLGEGSLALGKHKEGDVALLGPGAYGRLGGSIIFPGVDLSGREIIIDEYCSDDWYNTNLLEGANCANTKFVGFGSRYYWHSIFSDDSSLSAASFENASFRNLSFDKSCFRGANLAGARFENCSFESVDFHTVNNLEGARFENCDFESVVDLRHPHATTISFENCTFHGEIRVLPEQQANTSNCSGVHYIYADAPLPPTIHKAIPDNLAQQLSPYGIQASPQPDLHAACYATHFRTPHGKHLEYNRENLSAYDIYLLELLTPENEFMVSGLAEPLVDSINLTEINKALPRLHAMVYFNGCFKLFNFGQDSSNVPYCDWLETSKARRQTKTHDYIDAIFKSHSRIPEYSLCSFFILQQKNKPYSSISRLGKFVQTLLKREYVDSESGWHVLHFTSDFYQKYFPNSNQASIPGIYDTLLSVDAGSNNIRILSPETEAEPPSTGQKPYSEYVYDRLSSEARNLLEELHSDNNYTARIQCSPELRSSVIKEINKALYKNYVLLFIMGKFKICNFVDEDSACFVDLNAERNRECKTNLSILTGVLRGAELLIDEEGITHFKYRQESVLDSNHQQRFRNFMNKSAIVAPFFDNFRKLPREQGCPPKNNHYGFASTRAWEGLM